jgi:hypothetical protein
MVIFTKKIEKNRGQNREHLHSSKMATAEFIEPGMEWMKKLVRPRIAPKTPKASLRPCIAPKMYYTPEQVEKMDDHKLCAEFVRLTGYIQLSCTHCKGERSVDRFWMESIRKRAMKKGLSAEMTLPKTCDAMQTRNELCNPINNPAYSKLRSGITEEEREEVIQARQSQLESISMHSRPYRHTL